MSDLIEFLEARIGEDEARASSAAREVPQTRTSGEVWGVWLGNKWYRSSAFAAHTASFNPARVLAECAAKRELLQLARHIKDNAWQDGQLKAVSGFRADQILRVLLLPYTSHPDYDPTWKD